MKEQQAMINVDKLKLLPFSQLSNLKGYLNIIQTQFVVEDVYNLYLHLLKHPLVSEEQINLILQVKQPIQIISLIYNQKLLDLHIKNIDLPNSFTCLKLIKVKVSDNLLKALFIHYFQFIDTEQQSQQPHKLTRQIIVKEILNIIKYWHSNKLVSVKSLLLVFQEVYRVVHERDLEDQFKLVQLIISLQNYNYLGFLPHSAKFKTDIIKGLELFNNGVCNFLTPNIYLQLAKYHKDDCKQVGIFMDIYSTLNSFGVHLIKDLWEQFVALCNSKTKLNYISLDTLMGILIKKVTSHSNDNIPKNCIRDFLKSEKIDFITLFNQHQSVVYSQIIPILNSGQFYIDCALQKDSKFSKYIYIFFSKAYNLMQKQGLKQHLKMFIQSISKWITYDQALPAFLMVFNHIHVDVSFFGDRQVKIATKLMQKVYKNVHMRKRWQIINGLLECLRRFREESMSFKSLIQVLLTIPDEAYEWKFIHDDPQGVNSNKYSHKFDLRNKLKNVFESITLKQLNQHLQQLSKESFSNILLITDFYRLLKIHKWVPFVSLNDKIKQLSVSSYSTQLQHEIVILHMYYQSAQMVQDWKVSQCLNLIKAYITSYYHNLYHKEIITIIQKITKYVLNNYNLNSRQQLAKFVEWMIYYLEQAQNPQYLFLLYELLLKVIQFQYSTSQYEIQIEQKLYELPKTIHTLKTPKQNRYYSIKLRIELALSLLLTMDTSFQNSTLQQFINDPLSLMDRYDYQYYPEVFRFLKTKYLAYCLGEEKYDELDKLQNLILESLLSNLQYSIRKQDIISYFQFALDHRILETRALWENNMINKWIDKLIKTGNNYVYFHRILANTLYRHLSKNYESIINQQMLLNYVNIVYQLLHLEEYRGFDAEVAFYEQQKQIDVIQFRRKLPQKAEYYGMYVRFLFMKWVQQIVHSKLNKYEKIQEQFIVKLSQKIFKFSIEDETANRMMFSPSFRSKLRLWQFMQVLVPFYTSNKSEKYLTTLIPLFIKQLEQPNQPQIKHYIEMFLTRIILQHVSLFIPTMVEKLKSGSSLSLSITYVIISGLILKINFHTQLYNSLLSLICHNTAYLRGLTQYFCFYNFQQFENMIDKNSLIRKLYQQFKTNPDSIRLADRVHSLIDNYTKQINSTNLAYYCDLDIYKAGQIVEEYVQDGLKRIGLEIVKQIKDNDEGFILMKDLWKREAEAYLPKQEPISIEQSKGFQKKIDPVIEQIYSVEKPSSITKLRILASSLESIYNYGHLVRTGQIFSVQQLGIQSKSILSDDSFKSVSCTGEKWLNIKQVSNHDSMSYILNCIDEKYVPIIITQNDKAQPLSQFEIPEKVLLILPNEQKQFQYFVKDLDVKQLFVGTGLSVHVESAIFMWEYAKKNIIQKKI